MILLLLLIVSLTMGKPRASGDDPDEGTKYGRDYA